MKLNKALLLAGLGAGLWYVWKRPAAATSGTVSAGVESVGDVWRDAVQSVQVLPVSTLPAKASVATTTAAKAASAPNASGVSTLSSGAKVISAEAAHQCAEWGGVDGVTCLRKRA